MAATDATTYPVRNQAYRLYGEIRSSATGNLITGGLTGLAGLFSLDGAATSSTAMPVEIGTTGLFYVDLTSVQMNGSAVVLKITASNTNALDYTHTLYPADLSEVTGRADASGVKKLEAFCYQVWMSLHNEETINRSTGLNTRFLADSATPALVGNVSDDGTTGTRGKLA